jgi:tRNA(fMet)-specific endonuclease VapC
MMYCLDTDTLTHAHLGHRRVTSRIEQVGEENVATTIISAIEIIRGRQQYLLKAADGNQLLRAQELLNASEELLMDIEVLDVDKRAAAEFDRLKQIKRLRRIGRADLLIGCIALAHGATLVTRNYEHFREMPGLKTENWVDRERSTPTPTR